MPSFLLLIYKIGIHHLISPFLHKIRLISPNFIVLKLFYNFFGIEISNGDSSINRRGNQISTGICLYIIWLLRLFILSSLFTSRWIRYIKTCNWLACMAVKDKHGVCSSFNVLKYLDNEYSAIISSYYAGWEFTWLVKWFLCDILVRIKIFMLMLTKVILIYKGIYIYNTMCFLVQTHMFIFKFKNIKRYSLFKDI